MDAEKLARSKRSSVKLKENPIYKSVEDVPKDDWLKGRTDNATKKEIIAIARKQYRFSDKTVDWDIWRSLTVNNTRLTPRKNAKDEYSFAAYLKELISLNK